jgi:hypothetical protein
MENAEFGCDPAASMARLASYSDRKRALIHRNLTLIAATVKKRTSSREIKLVRAAAATMQL